MPPAGFKTQYLFAHSKQNVFAGNTQLMCQTPLLQHNWPACIQKAPDVHTRKIHQVLLNKDTASGSGSSWATSHCKLEEYARKISPPLLGHCQTWDKMNLRSGPAQVFLFSHWWLGTSIINLGSLGYKYKDIILLLVFDQSMQLACRWMALRWKGSLTKLRILFSKYWLSEALEGT